MVVMKMGLVLVEQEILTVVSDHIASIVKCSYQYQSLHIIYVDDHEPVKTIHRRYSNSQKVKIADYARMHGLRPAERKYGVHRRNIDRWKKIRVSEFKKTKLRKTFNRKGQGRQLSYPKHIDEELVQWVLEMRDLQLAVSSEMLKQKAKVVIAPYVATFKASNGWLEKFMR